MSFFHHPEPEIEIIILDSDAEEVKLLKRILRVLGRIEKRLPPLHRTLTAQVSFGGLMAATPGTQAVGSTLQAVFQPLEADGVTITPGAVLSTQPVWSSDNEAVATVDGNGVVTGVSAGTANITGTGGVFTDQDGTATAPLTASNSDTITQPTFRTVSAQVSFK